MVKTRIEPPRVQDRLLKNEPFWHMAYFKLKITKAQETQEELFYPSLWCLKEYRKGTWFRKSITRDKDKEYAVGVVSGEGEFQGGLFVPLSLHVLCACTIVPIDGKPPGGGGGRWRIQHLSGTC